MKTIQLESNSINKRVKLKNLPVEKLIKIYRKFSDPDILNLIINKTEKLAYKIAGDFKSDQCDKKDIHQVALTGLVIAINRFNTETGTRFSTFAVHYIRGEILHFIRDSGLVKSPRWLCKLNKIFKNYIKNFEVGNNRYPTIEEISEGINISVEGVNEFLKAREIVFYSYEMLNDNNKGKKYENCIYDKSLIRSREYKSFDLVMEDKIILWDAIDKLCSINKKIIVLSYFHGFTQREIGKKMGISQKSVSRKLKESIKILKEYFACS